MNHIFKRVLLRVLPRVWTWAPHSREPLTDFDSIFCGRDVFAMFAELCFAGSWALIMSSVYAGSFVSATKIQKYTAQLLTPQALLRPATSSNMPIGLRQTEVLLKHHAPESETSLWYNSDPLLYSFESFSGSVPGDVWHWEHWCSLQVPGALCFMGGLLPLAHRVLAS